MGTVNHPPLELVTSHKQSTHEQNLQIMDDRTPSWMQNLYHVLSITGNQILGSEANTNYTVNLDSLRVSFHVGRSPTRS
jgi:hypothetical protein